MEKSNKSKKNLKNKSHMFSQINLDTNTNDIDISEKAFIMQNSVNSILADIKNFAKKKNVLEEGEEKKLPLQKRIMKNKYKNSQLTKRYISLLEKRESILDKTKQQNKDDKDTYDKIENRKDSDRDNKLLKTFSKSKEFISSFIFYTENSFNFSKSEKKSICNVIKGSKDHNQSQSSHYLKTDINSNTRNNTTDLQSVQNDFILNTQSKAFSTGKTANDLSLLPLNPIQFEYDNRSHILKKVKSKFNYSHTFNFIDQTFVIDKDQNNNSPSKCRNLNYKSELKLEESMTASTNYLKTSSNIFSKSKSKIISIPPNIRFKQLSNKNKLKNLSKIMQSKLFKSFDFVQNNLEEIKGNLNKEVVPKNELVEKERDKLNFFPEIETLAKIKKINPNVQPKAGVPNEVELSRRTKTRKFSSFIEKSDKFKELSSSTIFKFKNFINEEDKKLCNFVNYRNGNGLINKVFMSKVKRDKDLDSIVKNNRRIKNIISLINKKKKDVFQNSKS